MLGQQERQTQLLVLGQQEHRCYHREYHHQTQLAAGAERIAGVGVAAAERIAAAAERIAAAAAAAAAERIAGVAAAAAAGGTAAAAERIAALQDVDTA